SKNQSRWKWGINSHIRKNALGHLCPVPIADAGCGHNPYHTSHRTNSATVDGAAFNVSIDVRYSVCRRSNERTYPIRARLFSDHCLEVCQLLWLDRLFENRGRSRVSVFLGPPLPQ